MDLLQNLKQTKELCSQNIQATGQRHALLEKLQKTSIDSIYLIIGVVVAFVVFFITGTLIDLLKPALSESLQHIASIVILISFFIYLFIFIMLFKKLGARRKKEIIERRIENRKTELDGFEKTITSTYEECSQLSVVPEKYWNEFALNKLIEYTVNKRADSLKEAINLFEDELIKTQQTQMLNSMSQLQEQALNAQRQTNSQLAWLNIQSGLKKSGW